MKCCDAQGSSYLTLPVLSLKWQCCSWNAEIAQGGLRYLDPKHKMWENFLGTVTLNFSSTQINTAENKATAAKRERAMYTHPRTLPHLSLMSFSFVGWQSKIARCLALVGMFWNPQEDILVHLCNYWRLCRVWVELLSKCSRDVTLCKETVSLQKQSKKVLGGLDRLQSGGTTGTFSVAGWTDLINNKVLEEHKSNTEICLRSHGALWGLFVFPGRGGGRKRGGK